MKLCISLALTILGAFISIPKASAQEAVHVNHEKVTAAWTEDRSKNSKAEWAACPNENQPLGQCSALVSQKGLLIRVMRRDKASPAEVHARQSHIWYVIDGKGTMVTGGKFTRYNATGDTGDLEGGEVRELVKGDVIVIPAGTPHWLKALGPALTLFQINAELANSGGSPK